MRAIELAQGFQGKGIPRFDIPVASRGPQDVPVSFSAVDRALMDRQIEQNLFPLAHHQFSVLTSAEDDVLFGEVDCPIATSFMQAHRGLHGAVCSQNGPSSFSSRNQKTLRMGFDVPNFSQVRGDVLNRFHATAFLGMPHYISFAISRPQEPLTIRVKGKHRSPVAVNHSMLAFPQNEDFARGVSSRKAVVPRGNGVKRARMVECSFAVFRAIVPKRHHAIPANRAPRGV